MTHYSYLDELDKKTKKIKIYWLVLIVIISLAIISLLVIIRKETNFFVAVQESKNRLTNEERLEIEGRVLAGWAKRDLGLIGRGEAESRVLGSNVDSFTNTRDQKIEIEQRLTK